MKFQACASPGVLHSGALLFVHPFRFDLVACDAYDEHGHGPARLQLDCVPWLELAHHGSGIGRGSYLTFYSDFVHHAALTPARAASGQRRVLGERLSSAPANIPEVRECGLKTRLGGPRDCFPNPVETPRHAFSLGGGSPVEGVTFFWVHILSRPR